jgi:hypothetical protein
MRYWLLFRGRRATVTIISSAATVFWALTLLGIPEHRQSVTVDAAGWLGRRSDNRWSVHRFARRGVVSRLESSSTMRASCATSPTNEIVVKHLVRVICMRAIFVACVRSS